MDQKIRLEFRTIADFFSFVETVEIPGNKKKDICKEITGGNIILESDSQDQMIKIIQAFRYHGELQKVKYFSTINLKPEDLNSKNFSNLSNTVDNIPSPKEEVEGKKKAVDLPPKPEPKAKIPIKPGKKRTSPPKTMESSLSQELRDNILDFLAINPVLSKTEILRYLRKKEILATLSEINSVINKMVGENILSIQFVNNSEFFSLNT